ncbi:tyrosine-type recombinase/integrase [Microbispora bryophytorum]|uniref:tyrosine-type recombinase/integrase n=1 Tax=Microbispora bryophytorum TaxID=1460882 RepID=UPI0037219B45
MHLNTYAGEGDEGLVFVGPKGAQLRRANFTRTWSKAITAAKLTGFHFHDLRHRGITFASQSGATLRELMSRMGELPLLAWRPNRERFGRGRYHEAPF